MASDWIIGLFCFTTVTWFWMGLSVFVWRYRLRNVTSLIQDEQSDNRPDVERSSLPPSYSDVEKHPSIYIININTVQEEISPPNYDTAMTRNLTTKNKESHSNTLALVVPIERF
jgi:hypothetical protein